MPRIDDFHLIDLIAQGRAVQLLLQGWSADEKIEWLAARGSISEVARRSPDYHQCYRFESTAAIECVFFIDGDEFVFIGDHTTFTAK